METVEVLRAAKALIDTPGKWAQGVCGRDILGGEIGPDDFNGGTATHAVSRCSIAALLSATGGVHDVAGLALVALAHEVGEEDKRGVIYWNNAPERTHAEVMAAFDRAIAAEEAKAQPTPEADEALSVMAACDAAAAKVTEAIMRREPDYPRSVVEEVARTEMFLCAQDVARIFPTLTPEVEATWSAAIREAFERVQGGEA